MNDTTTVPAHHQLAACAAGRIRQWQEWLTGRLQASDTFARQAGWTITPTRFGGRIYRDPRFSQLTAPHPPLPPHQTAPPASGACPAHYRHAGPAPSTGKPPAARPRRRYRRRNP